VSISGTGHVQEAALAYTIAYWPCAPGPTDPAPGPTDALAYTNTCASL
jgi:hypothetical protein